MMLKCLICDHEDDESVKICPVCGVQDPYVATFTREGGRVWLTEVVLPHSLQYWRNKHDLAEREIAELKKK